MLRPQVINVSSFYNYYIKHTGVKPNSSYSAKRIVHTLAVDDEKEIYEPDIIIPFINPSQPPLPCESCKYFQRHRKLSYMSYFGYCTKNANVDISTNKVYFYYAHYIRNTECHGIWFEEKES